MSEVTGPVEWVAITLPSSTAETLVAPIADLVERELIRIVDLVVVAKGGDGAVTVREFDELEGGPFDALDGDVLGLLGADDVAAVGAGLAAGEAVLVVVWENRWATAFAEAVRAAGGQLLGHDRIPRADVDAALAAMVQEVGT